jgi:hypothetical protein
LNTKETKETKNFAQRNTPQPDAEISNLETSNGILGACEQPSSTDLNRRGAGGAEKSDAHAVGAVGFGCGISFDRFS